jgi:hypothetical protein
MNRQNRTIFASFALAATLLASVPARADEGLAVRVATGVGQLIAAQGNAALVTIREEFSQQLAETIKPFLPAPEQTSSSGDNSDAPATM